MEAPTEFSASQAVDPALTASATPAADLAAAALGKLFNQQTPASAPVPPAPAPAPAPAPVPPAPAPAPAPTAFDINSRYAAPDPDAKPVVPELAEVPPQEDIRIPENTAENVGHAFAASRAEARRFRQMAEDYRGQVEKVRKDYETFAQRESALAEKLTESQKQVAELEDRLGKMDLEQAPAFREKYDAPIRDIQAQLARTLQENGFSPDEADDRARQIVLAEDAQSVQALLSELPDVVKGMAMYKFQEADALFAQRAQALNEWRATQTGLEQVSHREDAVISAQRRNDLVTEGLRRVEAVVPGNIWTDPEFARYRAEQEDKVKAWYGNAPEDQIAAAAVEGAFVAPYLYRMVDGLMNTVVQLKEQLSAGRRLRNPPASPYYPSVPLAKPPEPQKADDEGKSWTPVDPATSPVDAAAGLVASSLKKLL